jgi:hypothetical protein
MSSSKKNWPVKGLYGPLSRQQIASLSQSSCVSPVDLTERRGRESGRGAKLYDREKAWPSINHSIPSAWAPLFLPSLLAPQLQRPATHTPFLWGHLLGRAVLLAPVGPLCGSYGAPNMYDHRGRRRREWTQHGVLCCLAGLGRGADLYCGVWVVPPAVTYCTACPAKELLSCKLLAIPAAAAAGILTNVHKTPTWAKSRKEGGS